MPCGNRDRLSHEQLMGEEGDLKRHFSEKTRDLGVQICTIVADNILLAVWVVVEFVFEDYLVPRFPLASELSKICFWVFRVIFALSTLCPPLLFLYRDVRTMWIRTQAAIENEAALTKVRAAGEQK